MTPEQVDKEKADKVEPTKAIQSNKADIEESSESIPELGKSKPVDKTPPKESSRQYGKKTGDLKRVYEIAKEKGVDIDNIGEMPLMDADKGKITEAVQGAYGRELAGGIKNISDSITAPKNEERNKLDKEALMKSQKMQRKARWIDALSAFGSGLQGKDTKPEDFIATRLQRKQDKQFQDFKDVTERNQKTKYLWEDKTRKELIDWADQESKNMRESEDYRQKMAAIAAKNKQDQDNSDRDFEETKRYHTGMLNKKSGNDEKTEKIMTARKTYELRPEEASFMRGEMLKGKNSDALKKKYPHYFKKTPIYKTVSDGFQTSKVETGEYTVDLREDLSDDEIKRAYLEISEDQEDEQKLNERRNFQSSLKDQYKKPTTGTTQPQAQKLKSDPLGLGL